MLTNADWDEEAFSSRRGEYLSRSAACEDGSIIIDDTGIPKQGKSCVAVARQYFSALAKAGNCQVVVSLQYADGLGRWAVNVGLCLPRECTNGPAQFRRAQVQDYPAFESKTDIAIELRVQSDAIGVRHGTVVSYSGYEGC